MRVLFLLISICLAYGQQFIDVQNEVLVLFDNWASKDAFSTFLTSFTDRGYKLKMKLANDRTLDILRYEDFAYKHILVLAPRTRTFGGKLDVTALINFVSKGGNLMLVGDKNIGEVIRDAASEFGVEFDRDGTSVIDHFNYEQQDNGQHTRVLISPENCHESIAILGGKCSAPLLYEGVGLAADPVDPYQTSLLWGSETAYSYELNKPNVDDFPNTVGWNTKLIVAVQTRSNARVLLLGSAKFLTDNFMLNPVVNAVTKSSPTLPANREVALALGKWLTHDSGQLRIRELRHHKVGEKTAPWEYTIKDRIRVSVVIEQRTPAGTWEPYKANDVQLQLVRIDPFIITELKLVDNQYSTEFMLPDVYGVFKLVINYEKTGFSNLHIEELISIRPWKHTEYERFIGAAYPYYTGAASMMVGVFLFSFVFLYYRDPTKTKAE